MAASCHVKVNVATNFNQLLTEDLCQEHLQVLKTFTTSLRDKQFGCVWLFIAFFSNFRLMAYLSPPPTDRTTQLNIANIFLFCRRESVEEETFSDLSRVLSRLYDDLQTSIAADREPPSVVLQLLAECFRCQRNACVQNTRNQDRIRY